MALVAYRDRGDAYVTRVSDLTTDLDGVYATLQDFQAQGGGDTPESVNEALHAAVTQLDWSASQDVYKVVFLVGEVCLTPNVYPGLCFDYFPDFDELVVLRVEGPEHVSLGIGKLVIDSGIFPQFDDIQTVICAWVGRYLLRCGTNRKGTI